MSTMEEQLSRLVNKVWAKYQALQPFDRLLIAISGIPGSGKSTLAESLVRSLNHLALSFSQSQPSNTSPDQLPTVMVPMDGYHLTRAQLAAMPNSAEAIARRGAAFTFDPAALLTLVKTIRAPITASTAPILAPSFDHAVKDPQEGAIAIGPSARVVVFEGLYLSLDQAVWREVAELMDERWFVEVETEVARERLIPRHVKAGIAKDWAEAERRVLESDELNAMEILRDRLPVDEVIASKVDENWAEMETKKNEGAEREQLV